MRGKFFLILLGLFLTTLTLQAGDSLKVFRRTSIYAGFGAGEYFHANLNAEHFFANTKLVHIGARAGIGSWAAFSGESGQEGLLTIAGLLGRKHHFAELQAGSLLLLTQSSVKSREGESKGEKQEFYFVMSGGYNFRWRRLLLKANAELAPKIKLMTFNLGAGMIF